MKHLRPVLLAAALAVSTTHAHAFLHEWTVKRVDGLDGSLFTVPTDINNAGQVVGSSTVNGRSRGFLYSEGRTIDLGTFGGTQSAATAINEQGQVTGWALGTGDTMRQAFL